VGSCHLCNHPFRNLYEITESGDAEKALFAAVTRKHQIEADRVIGGIGFAAAVTMLRDALLSIALYVCLVCAAPVLGALHQRREARENVHTTKHTATDTAAAIPMSVALAGVLRAVIPESETMSACSMLVASHGQMATDSAPRRSERVTQPSASLLDASELYEAPTTPLKKCGVRTQGSDSRNAAHWLAP